MMRTIAIQGADAPMTTEIYEILLEILAVAPSPSKGKNNSQGPVN
jgi:hypothetical protein